MSRVICRTRCVAWNMPAGPSSWRHSVEFSKSRSRAMRDPRARANHPSCACVRLDGKGISPKPCGRTDVPDTTSAGRRKIPGFRSDHAVSRRCTTGNGPFACSARGYHPAPGRGGDSMPRRRSRVRLRRTDLPVPANGASEMHPTRPFRPPPTESCCVPASSWATDRVRR